MLVASLSSQVVRELATVPLVPVHEWAGDEAALKRLCVHACNPLNAIQATPFVPYSSNAVAHCPVNHLLCCSIADVDAVHRRMIVSDLPLPADAAVSHNLA